MPGAMVMLCSRSESMLWLATRETSLSRMKRLNTDMSCVRPSMWIYMQRRKTNFAPLLAPAVINRHTRSLIAAAGSTRMLHSMETADTQQHAVCNPVESAAARKHRSMHSQQAPSKAFIAVIMRSHKRRSIAASMLLLRAHSPIKASHGFSRCSMFCLHACLPAT